MKKRIKLLSLPIVLTMCFLLCGCNALDELRESRAVVAEDGTIVLADGSEYRALPECEELTPEIYNGGTVYVVKEDLPLLLTSFSHQSYFKSADGIFLQSYNDGSNIFYCRTDVYDKVLERINNGFEGEIYGYWYYDYKKEKDYFYKLKPDQAEAIENVLATQEGEQLSEVASLEYEYLADLWLCTEDKLFMRDAVDVCVLDGKYYVVDFGLENTTLYSVPDELTETFKEVLEKRIASDSYWE